MIPEFDPLELLRSIPPQETGNTALVDAAAMILFSVGITKQLGGTPELAGVRKATTELPTGEAQRLLPHDFDRALLALEALELIELQPRDGKIFLDNPRKFCKLDALRTQFAGERSDVPPVLTKTRIFFCLWVMSILWEVGATPLSLFHIAFHIAVPDLSCKFIDDQIDALVDIGELRVDGIFLVPLTR